MYVGLRRWPSGKETACQCRRHKRRGFDPWVGKVPWSGKRQPTPAFLPGESHGQRSLVDYSPWGHKESGMTDRARAHTHTPQCYGGSEQPTILGSSELTVSKRLRRSAVSDLTASLTNGKTGDRLLTQRWLRGVWLLSATSRPGRPARRCCVTGGDEKRPPLDPKG